MPMETETPQVPAAVHNGKSFLPEGVEEFELGFLSGWFDYEKHDIDRYRYRYKYRYKYRYR